MAAFRVEGESRSPSRIYRTQHHAPEHARQARRRQLCRRWAKGMDFLRSIGRQDAAPGAHHAARRVCKPDARAQPLLHHHRSRRRRSRARGRNAVREGVRVALAKGEAIFRLQEPKKRMRDQAAPAARCAALA
jgi:hypothetical protein